MDQEANRFDKAASTWDENPVRLAMAKAVAHIIMERIPMSQTMKALEIGSGTGLVTVQLAPHLGHVIALDSSKNMLDELAKKASALSIANVSPMFTDLETQEIPGGKYDLIFSNMTFHHIEDGLSLLKKIHGALGPGGIIALTDLDKEDGSFHPDMEGVHHLGFSRGDIVSAFETAGFKRCTIEDAHVMEKKSAHGDIRPYSLFLATGTKP